jgi:MFS transporter, DHA1 family, inner membrane transport protein
VSDRSADSHRNTGTGRRPDLRRLPAPLCILAVGAFFVGTDVFAIVGMLRSMAGAWHTSVAAAGQLMTVFALAYALTGPVLAAFTSRLSRRTVLSAALGAVVAGNLICASSTSMAAAAAGRALVGVGAAQFTPHVAALAAELVPDRSRGRALALVNGGLIAGSVAGVPLTAWMTELYGWRVALLCLSAGTACVALGTWVSIAVPAETHRPLSRRPLDVFRIRQVRTVLLITLLAVVSEYGVYTYAAAVFEPAVQGDGLLLGTLLLVVGVGGLVGNAVAGTLLDRPAGRHLVLVSMVTMTVVFAVLPFGAASFAAALPIMTLWGIAGWMYAAPQQHRLVRLAGPLGTVALSLNGSIIYVGAAVGALAGGGFLTVLGARLLAVPAAVCCAVAVAVEVVFRRLDRRPRQAEVG